MPQNLGFIIIILIEDSVRAETLPFKILYLQVCREKEGPQQMHWWMPELINGISEPKDEDIKRKQCFFRRLFQYHFPLWLGVLVWTLLTLRSPRLLQNLALTYAGTHKTSDSPVFSACREEVGKKKKETTSPNFLIYPTTESSTFSLRRLHFFRQIVTMPFSSSSLTALSSGYEYDRVQWFDLWEFGPL